MVPGIEPWEDRMLQGRMFSHTDTQMYRLGANFNQSSINRPRVRVTNNNQDGALNFGDRKGEVNYESSTLNELAQNPRDKSEQRCRSPRCSPPRPAAGTRRTWREPGSRRCARLYRATERDPARQRRTVAALEKVGSAPSADVTLRSLP
jgi:catalase